MQLLNLYTYKYPVPMLLLLGLVLSVLYVVCQFVISVVMA